MQIDDIMYVDKLYKQFWSYTFQQWHQLISELGSGLFFYNNAYVISQIHVRGPNFICWNPLNFFGFTDVYKF